MSEKGTSDSEKPTFSTPKCRVETVVVYQDRADVCRSLKTKVTSGDNEIILTDLSNFLDKDSVRVEGRGPATIVEVTYQSEFVGPDDTTTEANKTKQTELQKELDRHNVRMQALQSKRKRLEKQLQVWDGFATSVVKGPVICREGGSTSVALGSDTLKGMEGFVDMFDKQTTRLDETIHALDQDIKRLQEQISAVQGNLSGLNVYKRRTESKTLSIILDATEDCEVELFVSYVVLNASWTPKYDTRVFSADNQLKILYYGMIQQATGEDWEEAKLCLSTATPSVGGTCPKLPTQQLMFKPKSWTSGIPNKRRSVRQFSSLSKTNKSSRSWTFDMDGTPRSSADFTECLADSPSPSKLVGQTTSEQDDIMSQSMGDPSFSECGSSSDTKVEVIPHAIKVKESVASAMYEIARRSTIPSDNTAHKVSVAIIDLKPVFEYSCVPRLSAKAYLKAKVKNTSPYALLPGPTNIFLDNNFICKADMNAVSPQEEFDCSLGMDPAIRVNYKPVHKFREQSGYISKSVTTVYKQLIEIRNTRRDSVKILVSDQLPRSTEEKIKVHLQEPVIKSSDKAVRLNKNNNIEWDLQLDAGQTRELVLRYSVEHPANETLTSTEVENSSDN